MVLAKHLLQGPWSESLCLTEVVPGLSPVGVGQVVITLVAVPGSGFTTYLVFLLGRKAGAGNQGPSSGSQLCPHLWTEQ